MNSLYMRHLRLARGWRQEDLAERCQVSQSLISLVESGKVTPGIEARERIEAALGDAWERLSAEAEITKEQHNAV